MFIDNTLIKRKIKNLTILTLSQDYVHDKDYTKTDSLQQDYL